MKIYFISGMGADDTIFRSLRFKEFDTHFIPWQPVSMDESLRDYVKKLAREIDTSEPFILCGVSLGGICAQEMTRFLKPEKLILISTIKSKDEMPPILRVAASTRLQKLIPDQFYKWAAMHSGAVIGVKEAEDKGVFQEMLDQYGEDYYKWSIRVVAEWKGVDLKVPYLHLHGEEDRVFPARYIKNAQIIEGGNHYMIVNKAREISNKIREFIGEELKESS